MLEDGKVRPERHMRTKFWYKTYHMGDQYNKRAINRLKNQ